MISGLPGDTVSEGDHDAQVYDNNTDRMVTLQNQLLKEVILRHYTSNYKENLEYIIALMTDGIIQQNDIKRTIKKMWKTKA